MLIVPAALILGTASGHWQQLFNGKDLTGWKHVGPGKMVVENGLMHCGRHWLTVLDGRFG